MAVKLRCRECWAAFRIEEDFDGEAECPDCLSKIVITHGGRVVAWRGGGMSPHPRAARLALGISAATGIVPFILFFAFIRSIRLALLLGYLLIIPVIAIITLAVTLTLVSVARGERWSCFLAAINIFCSCLLGMLVFLLANIRIW